MSILKYRTQLRRALMGIGTLALLSLLSVGCNQDGVGIFYSISQEEKQITSKISEAKVHQVVEANVDKLYARTGHTIWEQQSNESWKDIGRGYSFVHNNSDGYLYVFDYNFDSGKGEIKSWDGSSWNNKVAEFSKDADLFDIENAYALEIGGGGDPDDEGFVPNDEVQTTLDLVTTPYNIESNFSDDVYDGAHDGTDYYLISKNAIYSGGALGNLSKIGSFTFNGASKSGDFVAITSDGTDLYLVTNEGQVFYGTDGSEWTYIDSADDSPVKRSCAVVTIDSTEYLIIGTDNGYYELDLTTINEVLSPTATSNTTDSSSFSAKYPELSDALVFDVYASNETDVFYLATENGLWKRTASGEFERQ